MTKSFHGIHIIIHKLCYSIHTWIHIQKILCLPITHRHFFKKLAQNRDYIQTHCNGRRNSFHFACRQWYLYNNPQIML